MPNPIKLPVRALNYWRTLSTLGREAKARHGVPLWRMMREHSALRRTTKISWPEYFKYGLFNPEIPREAKAEYIGHIMIDQIWSAFNPKQYACILRNKLVFRQICLGAGLPVADLLGVIDPDWGYAADGAALRTTEDLEHWIARIEDPNVVIKPFAGSKSLMIKIFRDKTNGRRPNLVALDGEEWSAERLHAFLTDEKTVSGAGSDSVELAPTFLIERRLRLHPDLATFRQNTLCAFHVLTLRDRGLSPQVLRATFKLPSSDSGVDGAPEGLLAIGVDIETGRLGRGRGLPKRGDLPDQNSLEYDPVTGTPFTGFQVPFWPEVQKLALRGAEAFPSLRAIGWDIAVTPDGPVIVEGNSNWGEYFVQVGLGRGLYYGELKTVADRLLARDRS